jgi:hypothetical protein
VAGGVVVEVPVVGAGGVVVVVSVVEAGAPLVTGVNFQPPSLSLAVMVAPSTVKSRPESVNLGLGGTLGPRRLVLSRCTITFDGIATTRMPDSARTVCTGAGPSRLAGSLRMVAALLVR